MGCLYAAHDSHFHVRMHHGARPTPRPVSARTSPQVSARVPFSRRRQPWGAAGIAFAGCALALILSSCAARKSTLLSRTIYNPGTSDERIEEAELRSLSLKTVFVTVEKDEESASFSLDREGAFDMRTGGSGEAFDGVTGPVESLRIGADAAVALAPFIAQYRMAELAADTAARKIADHVTRSKSSDAATSSTLTPVAIEGLDLAPGAHEPIGEATP